MDANCDKFWSIHTPPKYVSHRNMNSKKKFSLHYEVDKQAYEKEMQHRRYSLTQWDFRRVLVPYEFPLVILHTISTLSFHFRCMLRGTISIWMKRNLFQRIECHTHMSTSGDAKTSLTLNELIYINKTSTIPPSMHKLHQCRWCYMQNNRNVWSELKDNHFMTLGCRHLSKMNPGVTLNEKLLNE